MLQRAGDLKAVLRDADVTDCSAEGHPHLYFPSGETLQVSLAEVGKEVGSHPLYHAWDRSGSSSLGRSLQMRMRMRICIHLLLTSSSSIARVDDGRWC